MSTILKPHSQEWFSELEKVNPGQAAQTRQIIQMAGSNDVCSICGDEESNDYKLDSEDTNVSSLRLCDDCLGIRKSMHGENFVPLQSSDT